VHAPNPFLLLGNPSLTPWKLSLTYLEIPSLCCGANSRPLWSQVGYILTPPTPPIPLSPSQRFPLLNACPLKTTLRYRLHIVRYTSNKPAEPTTEPADTTIFVGSSGSITTKEYSLMKIVHIGKQRNVLTDR
jgi:hypothetical protein